MLAMLAIGVCAIGMSASPAFALSPSVETLPASSVGEKAATLNGKVNPNGLETKMYFEYGTTTNYGSKTAEVNVGSGTSTLEKSEPLSGLSPSTLYHYRIVASNSHGTSQGVDQTFTTVGPPKVQLPLTETEASGETATVKAFVTPNGQNTTYQFEYGTTSGSYTDKAPIPPESVGSGYSPELVSYKLTGLTPGTRYYWRITASNASGTVYGNQKSFLSSSHPGLQVLSVSDISGSMATLNAAIQPNGTATEYWFEYGTTASYGSKTSTKEVGEEVESSSVSESISELERYTIYHYRLVTENATGTHVSQDQIFTTLAPATLYLKGGAQLELEAPLKVFSSNLTFSSESGEHSCSETELSGEVQENPGSLQAVTTTKMQNGGGARCPWKPSFTIKYSVPTEGVTLDYAVNGSGEGVARTSKFVLVGTVYYINLKLVECEYNLALAGAFENYAALEPALAGETELVKGSGEYCPPPESVSGEFAVTSGGTAVEAKP
ncbi:MAG TPA: fibronectin type III domain-containing protein [Solirubrobacterales bacterium]|nr:fibronectin type III domain-containing protein [Solirubrobacterales bacterium]